MTGIAFPSTVDTGHCMIKTAAKSFLGALGYTMQRTSTAQAARADIDAGLAEIGAKTLRIDQLEATLADGAMRLASLERDLAHAHGGLESLGLRAPFTCPACGGHEALKMLKHYHGDLIKCSGCKAQLMWPLPSNEELAAIYGARNAFTDIGDDDVARYRADPSDKANHARHIARILERFGQPGDATVIEVGCMHGLVMLELGKLGYDCIGVDPSPEGIAFLNANGGRGYCGTLSDAALSLPRANAVVSFHALEHMPDPYAALRRIHDLLLPGGVLDIAVPCWGGLVAQRQLDRWKWFAPPFHLHYFTEEALLPFLASIGFEVRELTGVTGEHEVDELSDAFGLKEALPPAERLAAMDLMRKLRLGEALEVTAVRVTPAA
jgi:SAM-dependent methyltransferase